MAPNTLNMQYDKFTQKFNKAADAISNNIDEYDILG